MSCVAQHSYTAHRRLNSISLPLGCVKISAVLVQETVSGPRPDMTQCCTISQCTTETLTRSWPVWAYILASNDDIIREEDSDYSIHYSCIFRQKPVFPFSIAASLARADCLHYLDGLEASSCRQYGFFEGANKRCSLLFACRLPTSAPFALLARQSRGIFYPRLLVICPVAFHEVDVQTSMRSVSCSTTRKSCMIKQPWSCIFFQVHSSSTYSSLTF